MLAQGAALPTRRRRQANRRRRLRFHRLPEDPEPARRRSRRVDPGRAEAVSVAQLGSRRSRGDQRGRPERLGAIHQAPAGRIEEDSRHRPLRGAAADPLRSGRRRLGLSADGRRHRGGRLRPGDRGRPVRDETRPGLPGAGAVHAGGHRGRHRPVDALGAVQLSAVRPDERPAAGRGVRPRGSAAVDGDSLAGDRRDGPGGDQRLPRLAAEHPARPPGAPALAVAPAHEPAQPSQGGGGGRHARLHRRHQRHRRRERARAQRRLPRPAPAAGGRSGALAAAGVPRGLALRHRHRAARPEAVARAGAGRRAGPGAARRPGFAVGSDPPRAGRGRAPGQPPGLAGDALLRARRSGAHGADVGGPAWPGRAGDRAGQVGLGDRVGGGALVLRRPGGGRRARLRVRSAHAAQQGPAGGRGPVPDRQRQLRPPQLPAELRAEPADAWPRTGLPPGGQPARGPGAVPRKSPRTDQRHLSPAGWARPAPACCRPCSRLSGHRRSRPGLG